MMIKGIGGIFWRTNDVEATKKWYREALKLDIESWNGTVIAPEAGSETIFSLFAKDDGYFPLEQQAMLNFQMHNLEESLRHLEQLGLPLAKQPIINEYGKFAWIEDPDGRLIELWERSN